MTKLAAIALGVFLATPALAQTNTCFTRGKNTYCDNGEAWHRTPNGGIVPWGASNNDKNPSYHKYGNNLYGSDGSRRTKAKNGNINRTQRTPPTESDAIVDHLFKNNTWGGSGNWSGDSDW